jgi:hypothetical protein
VRTRRHLPLGPPSLLYNGYRLSFLGVKRPGRGVNHPLPSSVEGKARVEPYLHSSSVPSWSVLRRNLPLIFTFISLECYTVFTYDVNDNEGKYEHASCTVNGVGDFTITANKTTALY